MARSLGASHGWEKRHTAFDLWHLAAAWSLSAGVFLTSDRRLPNDAVTDLGQRSDAGATGDEGQRRHRSGCDVRVDVHNFIL